MTYLKLLLASGFLLFSAQTFAAGFYIEPGVFYEAGSNEVQWPSPLSSSTGTTRGLGVDLKLGMHFAEILYAGVDGSYSKVKFKNSATDYDADATSTTYGAILGVHIPVIGLRAWAGYIFGGTLDPDSSGSYDVKFDEAKGYKVGVGIKILIISLNVEYMDLKYDKSTISQPISSDFDNKLENKVGMFSVSFPIDL